MEPFAADDLDQGWVSVTDLLCIGRTPRAAIHAGIDVHWAVRVITDGLCVSVNDSETAVAVLEELGVDTVQAERQVAWARGQV